MTDELVEAVRAELARTLVSKGRLTSDAFVAASILGEEVGEVHRALLEIRRAGSMETLAARRKAAVAELVQVIAVASGMIANLQEAGK